MSAKRKRDRKSSARSGSVEDSIEPLFLAVGRIVRPHGVRGEVRVTPLSDNPLFVASLKSVYLGEVKPQEIAVEAARIHQDVILFKLAGCDNRDQAEPLRGQLVQILEADALPLAEGEYFLFQLQGLDVYEEDGRLLGELVEVIETGANNVFAVRGPMGELLLPDIEDVVINIDFDGNRMTVRTLPGLLPQDQL